MSAPTLTLFTFAPFGFTLATLGDTSTVTFEASTSY